MIVLDNGKIWYENQMIGKYTLREGLYKIVSFNWTDREGNYTGIRDLIATEFVTLREFDWLMNSVVRGN